MNVTGFHAVLNHQRHVEMTMWGSDSPYAAVGFTFVFYNSVL